MIIRQTTIYECWCPSCHKGQMKQILQTAFEEKIEMKSLIGRQYKCEICGAENTVDDLLVVIPDSFMVYSETETSKHKINNDLRDYLNS